MSKTIPEPTRPHMPGYGIQPAEKGLLPWAFVEERMAASRNYWVNSVGAEKRPHAAPVWGLWHAGAFIFSTGERSRKFRNLTANPEVVVHLESGDECVILEGRVDHLKDAGFREEADALYREKYGHPLVGESPIFMLKPRKALAWREPDFPSSATRWVFPEVS